ncbi:unnamed protein product [Auanema sp. JU1783]|nr:unnamed protein product [Auanema sp. JU1783]
MRLDEVKSKKIIRSFTLHYDSPSSSPIISGKLELSAISDRFETGLTEEAIRQAIQDADNGMEGQFHLRSRSDDPVGVYGSLMYPKSIAVEVSKASKVLLKATSLLIDRFGYEVLNALEEFDALRFIKFPENNCLENDKRCDKSSIYRSFSGFCNNLKNPEQGMAFQPLLHVLPAEFQKFDSPRFLSVSGRPLPSPRSISNRIHYDVSKPNDEFSLILMQFGQFLDHEITHSPVQPSPSGGNLNCSLCDSKESVSSYCNPIHIPEDDPFFANAYGKCLPFVRSLPGQRTFGPRNQMNQISSYIDGSVIYGSTKCEADGLRSFQNGELSRTAAGSHLGVLLPEAQDQKQCRSAPSFPCFSAGDDRNSQQPFLQSLHVIFLRFHNKLAAGLRKRNHHWNDETIFQESRKIVSAVLQNIVYQEFLPKIIGNMNMMKYDLLSQHNDFYYGYDEKCDASISQSFATAAFRFGHSLVKRFIPRLDIDYQNFTSPLDLADNFNTMEKVYDERNGSVDSILAGLLANPAMAFDRHVSSAVRNMLFAQKGREKSGFDLISINIQRARDHNVPSYNEHRKFCGLPQAHSFEALYSDMEIDAVEALKSVYDDVNDIDLFSGLTSEKPLSGAMVGPTTACLLADQFHRLKSCDRFYFENLSAGFSQAQLSEIRRYRLSNVICATTRFSHIQPDVFALPTNTFNNFVSCQSLNLLNLDLWKETSDY